MTIRARWFWLIDWLVACVCWNLKEKSSLPFRMQMRWWCCGKCNCLNSGALFNSWLQLPPPVAPLAPLTSWPANWIGINSIKQVAYWHVQNRNLPATSSRPSRTGNAINKINTETNTNYNNSVSVEGINLNWCWLNWYRLISYWHSCHAGAWSSDEW